MAREPIQLRTPLEKRPDNRLCEHCKNWIHKDRLEKHLKSKHGIIVQPEPGKTVHASVNKGHAKLKVYSQNEIEARFPDAVYEGQPRYEGGFKWEQGGIPGLGKRR